MQKIVRRNPELCSGWGNDYAAMTAWAWEVIASLVILGQFAIQRLEQAMPGDKKISERNAACSGPARQRYRAPQCR